MSQADRKSITMITIHFTCHMESARKRKLHAELESLHLQYLLSHNSIAECFTKKKNKQHFHDHAAYDYSRVYKSRCSVTIRMTYVAHPDNPDH